MVNRLIKDPMRIKNLDIYNIPPYILETWVKNYSSYLLPVQEKAVKYYGVLDYDGKMRLPHNSTTHNDREMDSRFRGNDIGGNRNDIGGNRNDIGGSRNDLSKNNPNEIRFHGTDRNGNHNLLVIAPPSSGKTLIGEMAILTHAIQQQKSIYLVPFPFMAEDKYHHFRKLYTSFGLDIVISSRVRKEDDQKIIKGNYDLAVIVYEKFNYFLLTHPDFLKNLSLLIIDEMQMINDCQKGPLLESMIEIIHHTKPGLKIIALSALTVNPSSLKKLLSAQLLTSFQRPVELRKGIVREGVFKYIEHNTKKTGKEIFFKARAVRDNCFEDYLKETVNYFIQKNESTLIFFPHCQKAREWAFYLSSQLKGLRANQAIDELYQLEDTLSREQLLVLLKKGIAYYNNDLTWEEKDLIKTYVKKGEIKVVCAAINLAMEIKPSFKNVILATEKLCIEKEYYQNNYQEPLSLIDIENLGGKAGILNKSTKDKTSRQMRKKEEFGRLIFLAHTKLQETIFKNLYFNLIADYYLQEEEILAEKYLMGKTEITNHIKTKISEDNWLLQKFHFRENDHNNLEKKMEINLKKLLDYKLITQDKKGQFILTPRGTLVIAKDIKVETYLEFKNWLDSKMEEEISNLEIIQILISSSDGKEFFTPDIKISHKKKTRLLYEWIENKEIKSIQQKYGLPANSIQKLGKRFSWLADSLAEVARSIGWDKDKPKGLEKINLISKRLDKGIKEEGLELAHLHIRGLNRNHIRTLVREGYTNEERLRQLSEEKLKHLLPEKLIKRIKQKLYPFSSPSLTKNYKPEAKKRKPRTDNRKPKTILQIDKNRPDRIIFLGKEVKVTNKGFSLLYLLAQHRGKVVSYEEILMELWEDERDAIYTRVNYHICKIRNDIAKVINNKKGAKKIENIFKTIPGRGLMLNIKNEELLIN